MRGEKRYQFFRVAFLLRRERKNRPETAETNEKENTSKGKVQAIFIRYREIKKRGFENRFRKLPWTFIARKRL